MAMISLMLALMLVVLAVLWGTAFVAAAFVVGVVVARVQTLLIS